MDHHRQIAGRRLRARSLEIVGAPRRSTSRLTPMTMSRLRAIGARARRRRRGEIMQLAPGRRGARDC